MWRVVIVSLLLGCGSRDASGDYDINLGDSDTCPGEMRLRTSPDGYSGEWSACRGFVGTVRGEVPNDGSVSMTLHATGPAPQGYEPLSLTGAFSQDGGIHGAGYIRGRLNDGYLIRNALFVAARR